VSGAIIVKNLKEVLAAIDGAGDRIEQGAQIGIAQAGLAIQRQAQINANTGTRRREGSRIIPPKHIGPSGSGPNVITGTLRRSIRTSVAFGFDSYTAVIGPTVEYARAVELGSPRWKSGVKYPYLEPAAIDLIKSGKINRIFVGAIKSKLGRG
jgi:hypothetical protein